MGGRQDELGVDKILAAIHRKAEIDRQVDNEELRKMLDDQARYIYRLDNDACEKNGRSGQGTSSEMTTAQNRETAKMDLRPTVSVQHRGALSLPRVQAQAVTEKTR